MFVSCAGKFYANAELNRIEARARASHAFARGSYHSVFILYVVGRSEPKKLRNVKATRTSAERTNKQKRLHPFEAKTKTQTQRVVLKHGGVTDESGRGTEFCSPVFQFFVHPQNI